MTTKRIAVHEGVVTETQRRCARQSHVERKKNENTHLDGANEEADEPGQAVLVHRVDGRHVAHAEEEHRVVRTARCVLHARRVNLALRLLSYHLQDVACVMLQKALSHCVIWCCLLVRKCVPLPQRQKVFTLVCAPHGAYCTRAASISLRLLRHHLRNVGGVTLRKNMKTLLRCVVSCCLLVWLCAVAANTKGLDAVLRVARRNRVLHARCHFPSVPPQPPPAQCRQWHGASAKTVAWCHMVLFVFICL